MIEKLIFFSYLRKLLLVINNKLLNQLLIVMTILNVTTSLSNLSISSFKILKLMKYEFNQ